jgi:actin-related protein
LTEHITNEDETRGEMAEVTFERFNVPRVCLANHSKMSLYASGKTSGLILDSGEALTVAVPIIL